MKLLLIGTGYMAREYAKVLAALNIDFDVAGRSAANCRTFEEMYPGIRVFEGGLEKMTEVGQYSHAIVCSNVEFLNAHTRFVMQHGIKDILLEKPGGVNLVDIKDLAQSVAQHEANVFIAYNRRFYASVLKAREMIAEDGGVLSFNFEFTEWPHVFDDMPNYEIVKNNLLFANSSHVIDMAFFMGGFPSDLNTYTSNSLTWHKPAIFSGAGRSDSGALFSYQANWKGPGRWSVEMITSERRYVFRPLEQLQVQQQKTVRIEPVEIDDTLDKNFKPGLYKQTEAFLFDQSNPGLIDMQRHTRNCESFYQRILAGDSKA